MSWEGHTEFTGKSELCFVSKYGHNSSPVRALLSWGITLKWISDK